MWNKKSTVAGAKHESQYFLGFDCAHSGTTTLKAYFMPEVRSAATGISKEQLVTDALSSLGMGLSIPWQGKLLAYLKFVTESNAIISCLKLLQHIA